MPVFPLLKWEHLMFHLKNRLQSLVQESGWNVETCKLRHGSGSKSLLGLHHSVTARASQCPVSLDPAPPVHRMHSFMAQSRSHHRP